jgi:hypothetical protein
MPYAEDEQNDYAMLWLKKMKRVEKCFHWEFKIFLMSYNYFYKALHFSSNCYSRVDYSIGSPE